MCRARIALLSLALLIALPLLGQSAVVVELFTSEGCSDCPPADDLLTALAQRPANNVTIIPLEFHVTYWDSPAWRDRFSDVRFTERQKEYQARFHLSSCYTPQSVIDGQFQTAGNDARSVGAFLQRSAAQPKPVEVDVMASGDSVSVTASAPAGSRGDKVRLAITEDGLTTNVTGGENHSRTLHHNAVVRSFQDLGSIGSGPFSRTVRLRIRNEWQRDRLHAVAFVQDGSDHVIGAATTPVAMRNP